MIFKTAIPLSLFALTGNAQGVCPDAMREVAARFFANVSQSASLQGRRAAPRACEPTLVYVDCGQGAASDLYVFERSEQGGEGFVIVGAHNAMPTADGASARETAVEGGDVIAYVPDGAFDADSIPPAMRWCMAMYRQWGVAQLSVEHTGRRRSVGPLVSTKWNQRAPYDGDIPVLDAGGKTFATGCVATATAQIMKFHEHPRQGVGSNSYTFLYDDSVNGPTTGAINRDFSSSVYDWANMLDNYNAGRYSDSEGRAVARLMYDVGAAGASSYGTDMTFGSERLTATALYKNFGYDKCIQIASRKYYTDDDWADLVYREVSEQRPVLYLGASAQAGHAFVCDGYDAATGLFSINWGWGGYCDGYFSLFGAQALTPDGTGTGGGSAGASYSGNQTIVYNIKPDAGGDFEAHPVCESYVLSAIDGGEATAHVDIDRSSPSADCTLYYTYRSYDAGVKGYQRYLQGIMLRHAETGACYYDRPQTWSNYLPFETSLLPYNGTYEVYPAYTTDNGATWHAMPYLVGTQTVPTITITGGVEARDISLYVDFRLTDCLLAAGESATINPPEDYEGDVTYEVCPQGVVSIDTTGRIVALAPGHAVITARAAGEGRYRPTVRTFDIAVEQPIPADAEPCYDFYTLPQVGKGNYADRDHLILSVPLVNNTAQVGDYYITLVIRSGQRETEKKIRLADFAVGLRYAFDYNFASLIEGWPDNTDYTICFYRGGDRTVPMNVPDITFHYAPPAVSIGSITEVIEHLRSQECNNLHHLHRMTEELLEMKK